MTDLSLAILVIGAFTPIYAGVAAIYCKLGTLQGDIGILQGTVAEHGTRIGRLEEVI